MNYLLVVCLISLSVNVWSQEDVRVPLPPPERSVLQEPEIYDFVEEPAEFPGGMEAFMAYIRANLVYPKTALENEIMGKCYIGIVVEIDGSITNVKVLRGVPDCKECDQEAIRLIKAMPNWKPGKTGGKVVRSRVNLPVSFRIY